MLITHSADYGATIDQVSVSNVSTECQLGCELSIDQDVDQRYQLRVSIETRPGIPLLVHMIQRLNESIAK